MSAIDEDGLACRGAEIDAEKHDPCKSSLQIVDVDMDDGTATSDSQSIQKA
ncbi:hypothetical protein [Bradyrhizobium hipponense]|uniref:hypothetical protein n=1 Tax=Bradyrhizobium hipponense TaxID=2605638 RepID=UPI0016532A21|nr:hypothetical protein [Bradyrhizobium hipponense]